ncbi:hypothetical protein PGTUg99_000383 [Puccinia graminis f. sp. tritici]|uniref:Integrase catalytic domain-containing protein n=1 Tax=Puccinia graminis f. sp. tritici TaxID=56615 RepID=A0A5B0NPB8_PUCGR|nr:hypothetical protein PGTUg99_000383 [Puccinia graminis f. sp. tritici]
MHKGQIRARDGAADAFSWLSGLLKGAIPIKEANPGNSPSGLLDKAGVKKLNTSGYHPQTNGKCERFNGVLDSSDLSSLSSESETELDVEDNQTLVPPRNGNLVSSQAWTPISTSGNPKKRKKYRENLNLLDTRSGHQKSQPTLTNQKKTKKKQNKKKSKGLSLTLEFLPHSRYPLVAITKLDPV